MAGRRFRTSDPLGALGRRRVTDAAATRRAAVDFPARAEGYMPGDTDFAWARLTPWRALMAAALDQYPTKVSGAEVVSAKGNASADLMAAWLQCRLGVPVEQKNSRGPGITAVRMFTPAGPIALTRPDGAVATFSIPGQPDRPVALKRRNTSELLSEELRRLDPDDVYAQTLACMVEREAMPAAAKTVSSVDRRSAQTAAEKAAARTAGVAGKAASPSLEAKAAGKGRTAKKTAATKKTAAAAKKSVAKKSARQEVGGAEVGRQEEHEQEGGRPVMSEPSILVNRDAEGLAHAVAARLITKLVDVQSNGGVAQVVLTGGRVAAVVYRAVAESPARTAIDWRRVEFWWGDERFLPAGDPDRNETQAQEALLSRVDVDPDKVHPMPADTGQGPEAAAEAYVEQLAAAARTAGEAAVGGTPTFDVVMLGVGPDGHVASLFPGYPELEVADKPAVAVHDSPKPPPTRISLTFPVLNRAHEVWFVVSGADKAEAVGKALAGADLPAAKPHGLDRTLWLLDEAAAGELS